MKQLNILITLLTGLFIGLSSCSNGDELLANPREKEEVKLSAVTFNFDTGSTTRMIGGVTGNEDAYVDNVWILQYDVTDSEEGVICQAYYVEVHEENTNKVANIFLESNETKTYKVLCLANTNDILLFSDPVYTGFSTITQLKTMFKQLSAKTAEKAMWQYIGEEGDIRQSLLMKGVARNTGSAAPTDPTAEFEVQISPDTSNDLNVQLFHLTARISLNLYHQYTIAGSDGDFFTLLSVQLKNVPSKLGYFNDAVLGSDDYINYITESIPDGEYDLEKVDVPKQFTWYIPRNPAGSTNDATYVEVTGYDQKQRITTYCFYPHTEESGSHNFSLEYGHAYSYDAKIKGSLTVGNSLAERTHFSVEVENAILNATPANCYVITGGKLTSIPLSRVQEYNEWLVANGTESNGYAKVMEEDEEWTAEILWSDMEGLIDIKGKFGKGLDKQFILVKPKNDQITGNALLLLKNSSNEVVWSWHLWVLPNGLSTRSYTPHDRIDGEVSSANDPTIDSEVKSVDVTYDVLTLNLGATVEGTRITSRGLHYQWGRKDPFPRTGSPSGTNSSTLADGYYNVDGDGYYFSCMSISTTERISSAVLSSQNPDIFFTSSWLGSNYGSKSHGTNPDNRSWESDMKKDKSIFDPCPLNYRVPDVAFFGTELSNKMNRGSSNPIWSTGWDWSTVYRLENNVPSGFNGPGKFPTASNRNGAVGDIRGNSNGYYWSSSSSDNNAFYMLFSDTSVNTRVTTVRPTGLSVRCVLPLN